MDAVALINGQGSDERSWQGCDWLWQQPETGLQALCAGAARIVVVAPHPDDEVLACGGLLGLAAANGLDTWVVAVTDGEACYPDEAWWTPGRLRDARRHELAAAVSALGIGAERITHLGIADGGVAAREAVLQRWLRRHLHKDDLVLAPWRFDGHPDHEAAGRAACHAARAVGCARLEYPVWAWHWMDPAYAHIAWERPRLLDISTGRDAKQRAIAEFRTQTGDVEQLQSPPILPAHVLARFHRNHEVYLA